VPGALAAPHSVAAWAADRDGSQLLGLDAGLHVELCIELPWPVAVEARTDGGAWVASAVDGDPLGDHELVHLDAWGAERARRRLAPLLDLAVIDGRDALAVDWPSGALGSTERAARIAGDGALVAWAEIPDARAAAGRGDQVLVGTETGRLVLTELQGPLLVPLLERELGWPIADLAPAEAPGGAPAAPGAPGAPDADGGWWVLDAGSGGRLTRLGPDLATLWEVASGLHLQHLAPVPASEQVWLADTTAALARRYGPAGALELALTELAFGGFGQGAGLPGGGVWLAAPGAILSYDGAGAAQPGQGGFEFLVDLARVPGR
jgi:hypothetical protein